MLLPITFDPEAGLIPSDIGDVLIFIFSSIAVD